MALTSVQKEYLRTNSYVNIDLKHISENLMKNIMGEMKTDTLPSQSEVTDFYWNTSIDYIEQNYPRFLELLIKVHKKFSTYKGYRIPMGIMYLLLAKYCPKVLSNSKMLDAKAYYWMERGGSHLFMLQCYMDDVSISNHTHAGAGFQSVELRVENINLIFSGLPIRAFNEVFTPFMLSQGDLLHDFETSFHYPVFNDTVFSMCLYFWFKYHNYEIEPYFLAYMAILMKDRTTLKDYILRVRDIAKIMRNITGIKKGSDSVGLDLFFKYYDISKTSGLLRLFKDMETINNFYKPFNQNLRDNALWKDFDSKDLDRAYKTFCEAYSKRLGISNITNDEEI